MRRSWRITDRLRSGWRSLKDPVLSSTTSAPTLLEWPCQQGRNDGGKGEQFPGRWIPVGALNHCGGRLMIVRAPKSLNNVTSTFLNTVQLVTKNLRLEHGGAKLALALGTSHVVTPLPAKNRVWIRFNRLRHRSCWYKVPSAACEHDAEQTSDHVVLHCPIHGPPYRVRALTVLDDEKIEWLPHTCLTTGADPVSEFGGWRFQ